MGVNGDIFSDGEQADQAERYAQAEASKELRRSCLDDIFAHCPDRLSHGRIFTAEPEAGKKRHEFCAKQGNK